MEVWNPLTLRCPPVGSTDCLDTKTLPLTNSLKTVEPLMIGSVDLVLFVFIQTYSHHFSSFVCRNFHFLLQRISRTRTSIFLTDQQTAHKLGHSFTIPFYALHTPKHSNIQWLQHLIFISYHCWRNAQNGAGSRDNIHLRMFVNWSPTFSIPCS